MEINIAVRSDTGPVREENQDHYLVSDLRERMVPHDGERIRVDPEGRGVVLAVADGMGGHLGGRQAAELALSATLSRLTRAYPWKNGYFLSDAIEAANAGVHERASSDPRFAGMGTTLTAAVLAGNGVFVGHVGDSRAYLLRDGKLERLTTEHSFLVKVLGKDPDEARSHAKGSVLANVVGGKEPEISVELSYLPLRTGDLLLLCSDGLWGVVPDEAISGALAEPKLERACAALMDAAVAHKTTDNVTVLLARFEGDELAAADADPASCAFSRLVEVEWDQEAERMGTVLRARPPWPPRRPFSPKNLALGAVVFLAFLFGGRKLVSKIFPPRPATEPVVAPILPPERLPVEATPLPDAATQQVRVPSGGKPEEGGKEARPSQPDGKKPPEEQPSGKTEQPRHGKTQPADDGKSSGALKPAEDAKASGAGKPAEVAKSTETAPRGDPSDPAGLGERRTAAPGKPADKKPPQGKEPAGAKEAPRQKPADQKKSAGGKDSELEKPSSGKPPARPVPQRPGRDDAEIDFDNLGEKPRRK